VVTVMGSVNSPSMFTIAVVPEKMVAHELNSVTTQAAIAAVANVLFFIFAIVLFIENNY
jgi:hypothetical protein